ncbi:hypothetical protein ERJ75_000346200 [Trypanosoma vivax]|nr:hypothetical protein ERJ75_000346200 [Trypanosoma vivax]
MERTQRETGTWCRQRDDSRGIGAQREPPSARPTCQAPNAVARREPAPGALSVNAVKAQGPPAAVRKQPRLLLACCRASRCVFGAAHNTAAGATILVRQQVSDHLVRRRASRRVGRATTANGTCAEQDGWESAGHAPARARGHASQASIAFAA